MTLYVNKPSTLALADNTTATSANTAAPQALTPVTSGTGTVRFRTPGKWEMVGPASSVARLDLTINTPRAKAGIMFDQTGQAAPTADCGILRLFSSTQTGAGLSVAWLTDKKLRVFSHDGSSLWTSPSAVTGRFRVYLGPEIGTGTGDGEIHAKVFVGANADGTTAGIIGDGSDAAAWSFDTSTGNAGAVNFTSGRIGKLTSAPVATIVVEYAQFDDASYTPPIGPITTVAAPVLTYTRQTVIEIDGSATNSGVVTLATDGSSPATPASITGPDGSGVFRVVPPGTWTTNMVLNLVATNSGGTDTEVITITPTGGGGSPTVDADVLTYNADTDTWGEVT